MKGRKNGSLEIMTAQSRLANDIRIHRRKTGLSQHDLGQVLGYLTEGPVARHEDGRRLPSLRIAIGYEIIFRVPVSEIFTDIRNEVSVTVEARLAQLEQQLGQHSARDRDATAIARKLTWLYERNNAALEPGL
jgi:DNA-binding XRE family transcriptional regulator